MTASLQPQSTSASRRALLAGALGGIGAWAVSAIGRTTRVRAADDAPVLVGGEYTSSSVTKITNATNDGIVIQGISNAAGIGVSGVSASDVGTAGLSTTGTGVDGYSGSGFGVSATSDSNIGAFGFSAASDQPGILGKSGGNSTGVQGFSGGGSEPAPPPKTGVFGYAAQDAMAIGVYGESPTGVGVGGVATSASGTNAAGVVAKTNSTASPALAARANGNSTAVMGFSGTTTFPSVKAKTGVFGMANQDSNSKGVWGESAAGRGVYGVSSTGYAGYFSGKVYTTKWYELTEVNPPSAPGSNKARLFLKDNGSGKTQLCVRFNTGAVQVIATQP